MNTLPQKDEQSVMQVPQKNDDSDLPQIRISKPQVLLKKLTEVVESQHNGNLGCLNGKQNSSSASKESQSETTVLTSDQESINECEIVKIINKHKRTKNTKNKCKTTKVNINKCETAEEIIIEHENDCETTKEEENNSETNQESVSNCETTQGSENKSQIPKKWVRFEFPDGEQYEKNSKIVPENIALEPQVLLSRVTTEVVESVSDQGSANYGKRLRARLSPLPVDKEEIDPSPRRGKQATRSVALKKVNYREVSTSEDDEPDPERKLSKSRRKKDASAIRPIKLIELPPMREKRAPRSVAQKKVNYHDRSSSEDDEDKPKKLRSTKMEDSSEEDYSSKSEESESSDDDWPRGYAKKTTKNKETEYQLKRKAMQSENLSEYEQQRNKNIEEKLAFLESLKQLDGLK